MIIQNWADLLFGSLRQVWVQQFIGFVSQLIVVAIVFIVGLIIAYFLRVIVEKLIGVLKVDKVLSSAGLEKYVERAGLKLNIGRFLGQIVYWFIIFWSLIVVSEKLGFPALTGFLEAVATYIPIVIVAIIIMVVTILVANFLRKVVKASAMSARLHAANSLGAIAWWSVMIVGIVTALKRLGLDVTILDTLIIGVIAMFAIAGGIAFGFGGKEYAQHLIEKFREQTERK